jgi:hypothetical protein
MTMTVSRRFLMVLSFGAAVVLSACGGGTFRTYYADPIPAEVSRDWRVVDVAVSVPQSLVVSEERSLLPRADIVWREDPVEGDRREQVALIMKAAAEQGASGLRGSREVRLRMTVTRFHALTFEAETRLSNAGVHNVDFVAEVTDVRTGEVLAGPETIEAAFPALAGAEMQAARAAGQSQKSMITAHVRNTIAGWLGVGPDNRTSFSRPGN